jgi:hypothetical protein
MLQEHAKALANAALSLGALPNAIIGLTCIGSEQIVMKRAGAAWKYYGFGEHGVRFYGILPSEWMMFGGNFFSAGFQFEQGPLLATGSCEKIDTK